MFAKKLLDPESSDGHVYVYTPDREHVYCIRKEFFKNSNERESNLGRLIKVNFHWNLCDN